MILTRITLFFFVLIGSIIHWTSPERVEAFLQTIPYRCPLRLVTGWKCAFCGMTHSWIAIFQGDLSRAFSENWFGPPLWFASASFLVLQSFNRNMKIPAKPILILSVIVLAVYAIFRNLN